MYKTLNLLSQTRDSNLIDLNNEQLVELYQKNHSDTIISEIFCKNFEVYQKLYKKFPTLDNDERVSSLLQWTTTSLNKYSTEKGVKFITFLYGNLTKKLLSLYAKSVASKRKDTITNISIDDATSDGYLISELIPDNSNEDSKLEYKLWIKTHKNLTPTEKLYCLQFLNADKPKASEIKKEMGLDPIQTYAIRQKLKQKLKNELGMEK